MTWFSRETHERIVRAEEFYNNQLRTSLEASHLNYFVAIEPDSGAYS